MKKRTIFAGLGVLLVLGLILAVGAALDLGAPGHRGMRGNHAAMPGCLGLSENATPGDVWETVFDRRIETFGLTDDSTIRELKSALLTQRQQMRRNMPKPPQNATMGSMPAISEESCNMTCPIGRGGRMDNMMFGI
jgi:hypothetical protein